MLDKEQVTLLYNEGVLFYGMIEILECSSTTLRKYLKLYALKTYKGFYSTGKKIGRRSGFSHSEEHKQKMSEKFSGKENPFYGRKHSDETKDLMSNNHADFSGDKNPFKKSIQDPIKLEEHKQRCQNIWDSRDEIYRKNFGKKNGKYCRNVPGIIWQSICNNAKIRKLLINISPEYIYDLLAQQDYKCALSGLPINLPKNYKEYTEHKHTASLDRKDSNKHYDEDNVQWVHKVINKMKHTLSDEEFIKFCKEVTKKNE